MPTIQLTHFTFGFATQAQPLFQDVSLNLDTGWHLGLVGRNGRGKTTLLRLLQGQLTGRGTLVMPRTAPYFPQPILDPSQLTLDAMQAVSTAEQWQLERELRQLNVDPAILWRPYADLSGGEQTKVRLALLFALPDQFALIDEPTNHLDAASRAQVAAYLKRQSGFIVISHDRDFLDAVTDHTLALDKQTVTLTAGNYSAYASAKANQDAFEQATDAKLRQDIARLKQTARQKAQWATSREGDKHGDPHQPGSGAVANKGFIGARAARVMQKRKNLEHRLDRELTAKAQLLQNIETVPALTLNTVPDHHEVYLDVQDLWLDYDGQPLFAPVSFTLRRGDRLALVGPNGSGKSSLIAALLHQFTGTVHGTIRIPQSLTLSAQRQTYGDNRGPLQAFAAAHHLDHETFLNNLKKLGVPREAFTLPIEHLSAGQQKKVELARCLGTPASLMIWDEPLNYLDLANQEQLTASVLAHQPTLLVVEHDAAFIHKVATQIVTLTPPTGDK
ncbi:ribosomal protection-like ABC-F family protein [Lacticaseibacillus daqingensis]|uniref:ribosomal protection-like ABC-F family protein n=1 Tax=Lacticaseibacillus daqingensis TaxID=2486014 RepID=UPI000F78DEA6|nr:ATP-binding cassette domain-containing protein [Lacticaseibacillus daqingensis]